MRLAAGALALGLFASFAHAEDTRTAEPLTAAPEAMHDKVSLRVVRVMSDSHQALLFDRARATHVLAEVGGTINGYTVESIDDDEVTLRCGATQIVLAAPGNDDSRHDRDLAARQAPSAERATHTGAAPDGPMPVDPYGEVELPVVEAPGAADRDPARHPAPALEARAPDGRAPDGQPTGIRVAEAPTLMPAPPADAPPDGVPASGSAKAPDARAADAARAPDRRTLDARALADVLSSDSRTASVAPSDAIVLTRAEVDGALADFARLSTAVRGSFSASGLVIDAVGDGTIFQRAGLRAGDVITAVDGVRMRSLDDAAAVYARASTSRAITAQLVRGGTPMTLRVAIQ